MYLNTRAQRGLSVSTRTVGLQTSGGSNASWRSDRMWIENFGSRCVAPRKDLSYFVKTADRQQVKNRSDGLRTMQSTESSTSTNPDPG
jgi:hypothetical protein